jgi:hypothetical protein
VPESRLSFDPRGIMPLTMNPLDEFPETSAQSHPDGENDRLAFPLAVFSKPRAEPGLCCCNSLIVSPFKLFRNVPLD